MNPLQYVGEDRVSEAVAVLRKGGVVAFPTETVYGLGADAENDAAVRRVYAIKGRPSVHPVIIHIGDKELLKNWAVHIPDVAFRLAERFWPGPLTLVLQRYPRVSDTITGGQDTVGLRVPAHPLALALLCEFGGGIAAPSANRFGAVSPTTADHVRNDLGNEVDYILDGGPCTVGLESSIVSLEAGHPVLLRPGGISLEALEEVVGHRIPVFSGGEEGSVRSPGQYPSHYAPKAKVILSIPEEFIERIKTFQGKGEKVAVLSAVDPGLLPAGAVALPLPESPEEAARVLYDRLREADQEKCDVIVVVLPFKGEKGINLAVFDRLRRAAGGYSGKTLVSD